MQGTLRRAGDHERSPAVAPQPEAIGDPTVEEGEAAPEPRLTAEDTIARVEEIVGGTIELAEEPSLVRVARQKAPRGWRPADEPTTFYRVRAINGSVTDEYEVDAIDGHLRSLMRGGPPALGPSQVTQEAAEAIARKFLAEQYPDPDATGFELLSTKHKSETYRFHLRRQAGDPPGLLLSSAFVDVAASDESITSYRAKVGPDEPLLQASIDVNQATESICGKLGIAKYEGAPVAGLVQDRGRLYWSVGLELGPGDVEVEEGAEPPRAAYGFVDAVSGEVLQANISHTKGTAMGAGEAGSAPVGVGLTPPPPDPEAGPAFPWLYVVAGSIALLLCTVAAWAKARKRRA